MSLLDKLRDIRSQPADGDLLDFLGVQADALSWSDTALTVGGETVPMAAVRLAMSGGPIPQTDRPRSINIGDL